MRSQFALILLLTLTTNALSEEADLNWWSLQSIKRLPFPKVQNTQWPFNAIDTFILAKLEQAGLTPAPDVDTKTLIRRLHYDLLGLPPTPEDLAMNISIHERIQRLLASPHYGEKWARHWLDLARFAESQGFERDKLRDHSWPYRDYVIRAFNSDKPYDEFIKEQIAGDVLPNANSETIAATGFLVAGPWDEVGQGQQGKINRMRVREEELEEMISVTSQTFLGMTVNCARCHDHKFDPIPQEDYYRFKSALEGVRPDNRPISTFNDAQRQLMAKTLQHEIAQLEKELSTIDQKGRRLVLSRNPKWKEASKDLPTPYARWTFEDNAKDEHGRLHAELHREAKIENGRLIVNGRGAMARTNSLPRTIREKTLEAWVALPTLNQGGGGVITLEMNNGVLFDSIVYGERQPKKWMAGSNSFQRTRNLNAPQEQAKPDELIHMAIVYTSDNRIQLYRNGQPYGESYVPGSPLQTYESGKSRVLFGQRHTGGGRAFLQGEIEEARLYDRSLSAGEVKASFQAGVDQVPFAEVLKALTPKERQRRKEIAALLTRKRQQMPTPAPRVQVYAVNPKNPPPTHLLRRGDVERPKQLVSARGLSAIKTLSADLGMKPDSPEGQRRLKFAQWIADSRNPLTARVIVNRLWQYHFGQGLVAKPSDFGFNGGKPTHPQLLDWLASELIRKNWSLKHIQQLILNSHTYQQSSQYNSQAASKDADNQLLWRFSPRRLSGEELRDSLLAISGRLNDEMYGPSFRPFTVKIFNSHFYLLHDRDEPQFNRRSVYRMHVCSGKDPMMDAFDCPDPGMKIPLRSTTTTPLQALQLMNNSFVQRQAQYLAERVKQIEGMDISKQVNQAYLFTLGRKPRETELQRTKTFVEKHGLNHLCWVLFNSSEMLYLR